MRTKYYYVVELMCIDFPMYGYMPYWIISKGPKNIKDMRFPDLPKEENADCKIIYKNKQKSKAYNYVNKLDRKLYKKRS